MHPENIGKQFISEDTFQKYNTPIFRTPAFLSDKEGQAWNVRKLIERHAARTQYWGGKAPETPTYHSEHIWWHSNPQPPSSERVDGAIRHNPDSYMVHESDAHITNIHGTNQPISSMEPKVAAGLIHHSPPAAHEDISTNGLRPSITATSGHDTRRFGVFLSPHFVGEKQRIHEARKGNDAWKVFVPKNDLRKGPDGDFYVERHIKSDEIVHVGHVHSSTEIAPGRAIDCKECAK
jgi:hypothetical protein